MIARVGLRSFKSCIRSRSLPVKNIRYLTTKTSITDHATGRVITLSDPSRPEIADYPNPEPKLAQEKDPYIKYDDQQNRRNIGEPVNIDDDYYDMWSPDYFNFVSDKTALKHNGIFFSLIFGFGAAIWYFELNPAKPAMPRSYPSGGLAKELGSGDDKDDFFYRVKPDITAEEELGFLAYDESVAEKRDAYVKANSDFINA
ncbi:uncharacterized protein PRCAT00001642001 [Priceomyces carsonii]|uniref:uncharacterized protein n=1 Tax=Priceomyces carsonii TaxID=28549 RepID=UPI002ED7F06C|nr:unnamed protein product [Priceomyces carsonii]